MYFRVLSIILSRMGWLRESHRTSKVIQAGSAMRGREAEELLEEAVGILVDEGSYGRPCRVLLTFQQPQLHWGQGTHRFTAAGRYWVSSGLPSMVLTSLTGKGTEEMR